MEALLQLVFELPEWAILYMVAFFIVYSFLQNIWRTEPSAKRLNGILIQNRIERQYDSIIAILIQRYRSMIGASEKGNLWTDRLFSLCLMSAVAMPIVAMTFAWAITGDAPRLGGVELLPPTQNVFVRLSAVLAVILIYLSYTVDEGSVAQRTLQLAGAGFAFFVFLNINILATLAASFVVWATAGALGGAVGLAALTVAVSQMVSLENPAGPVAALALAAIYQKLVLDRSTNAIGRRILYVIICIVFSAVLISLIESFRENNYLIFLFFILIPSLICIGNFIALGLTSELLSRFEGHRRAIAFFIDLASTVLMVVTASVCLILFVAFIRQPSGIQIVDLPSLFSDLRTNPNSYMWLIGSFLTILIPVIIHFAIIVLSFMVFMPRTLRQFVVSGIQAGLEGGEVRARLSVMVLSVFVAGLTTASLWVPYFVATQILSSYPLLGATFLDFVETFATFTGAI